MAQDSRIQIILEYKDNATERLKKSFSDAEQAVQRFTNELAALNGVVNGTMTDVKSSVDKTMSGISTSLRRVKPVQDEHIGGIVRMAREWEKFRIGIARLRNSLILFFFAIRPVINFLREGTQEMREQEDATNRLSQALQNQGTYSKQQVANLIDLSNALQRTTRYGNEAIENVFQTLISVGGILPSQLEEATKATLDFATATGRDLTSASELVAKAAAGSTAQLARYGIVIDRNIPDSEKFAKVLEYIQKRFGGQAQNDVKNFSGALSQLNENWKDFVKNVTTLVFSKTPAGDFVVKLNKSLGQFNDTLEKELNLTPMEQGIKRVTDEMATLDKRIKSLRSGSDDSRSHANPWLGVSEEDIQKASEAYTNLRFALDILTRQKQRFDQVMSSGQLSKSANNALKAIGDFNKMQEEQESKSSSHQIDLINRQFDIIKSSYNAQISLRKELHDKLITLKRQEQYVFDQSGRQEIEKQAMVIKERLTLLNEFKDKANEIEELRKQKIFEVSDDGINIIKEFTKASATALEDGFFNIVTGQFRKLSDVVNAFGETMLRTLLKIAANEVLVRGLGLKTGVASIFGASTGAYVRNGLSTTSGYHSNETPTKYAGAFASGGAVLATLHEGEGVLNRNAMRNLGVDNLNKLNRGQGLDQGGDIINYYIQTIDERSFRDRLSQNPDIFQDSVGRGISDNNRIRKTVQRFT